MTIVSRSTKVLHPTCFAGIGPLTAADIIPKIDIWSCMVIPVIRNYAHGVRPELGQAMSDIRAANAADMPSKAPLSALCIAAGLLRAIPAAGEVLSGPVSAYSKSTPPSYPQLGIRALLVLSALGEGIRPLQPLREIR